MRDPDNIDLNFRFARQKVQEGDLRGAATSLERMKAMPELPTMKEMGYPDMVMTYWSATFLPAVTPRPIVQRLHDAVRQVTSAQETKDLLAKNAIETWPGTVEQFSAFIRKETADLQADYKRLKIDVME